MDTTGELLIRLGILSAATLMLFVMLIERRKHPNLTPSQQPPTPGAKLLWQANIPEHRPRDVILNDVAYLDVTETTAEFERP